MAVLAETVRGNLWLYLKETIYAALSDITKLPYTSGKEFEDQCVDILVQHFALETIDVGAERQRFGSTSGATFYSNGSTDGVVIIYQPYGSQASPDIQIWFQHKLVLNLECKLNKNASQPNWNQHIPYQDVLYLWKTAKREHVVIRAGWQLIGPAEEVAVRAFYRQMKDLAKSFQGPLNQSHLDVALRYNLSHERRAIVFADDPNLQAEALDWACKLFE